MVEFSTYTHTHTNAQNLVDGTVHSIHMRNELQWLLTLLLRQFRLHVRVFE